MVIYICVYIYIYNYLMELNNVTNSRITLNHYRES